ncbi:unnamed protein product [Umbelopsis vinacea]
MAHHVTAWMPLTDYEPKSTISDRLFIPFITSPSAVHYSVLEYRGSSAPPVLSCPDKQSARNTFAGNFRSCKIRPASSYAESGPHSQASMKPKHLVPEKLKKVPASPGNRQREIMSGGLAMDETVHNLSIGESQPHDTLTNTPSYPGNTKKLSDNSIKLQEDDEKSFVSLEESQHGEETGPNLYHMYGAVDYDPYRPRSFPYFLPKPLKRVLNRHTWTDIHETESIENTHVPSFSLVTSTNSQVLSKDTRSLHDSDEGRSLISPWRGEVCDPSPAPSSTQIMANMHRMQPTISSLSMSDTSCHMLQAAPNVLTSPLQMVDIDAIEKGFIYNPTISEDRFWNSQTFLFLFGFIAFPCWWIGAFKSTTSRKLKMYNAKPSNEGVQLDRRALARPAQRSPSPIAISVYYPRSGSKQTAKQIFQQLNRIMAIMSVVGGIIVCALLIWYELGYSRK